jgi:hypothetical protein
LTFTQGESARTVRLLTSGIEFIESDEGNATVRRLWITTGLAAGLVLTMTGVAAATGLRDRTEADDSS